MSAVEQPLPGLGGALVPGPVFFSMTLLGDPPHKARHRSRIVMPRGKKPFIHNYPDPTTQEHEKVIAQVAALRMRGMDPIDGPVCLLVIADRRVPMSWSKKERAAALEGRILPTPKPDWDNHGKITDALKGIVWTDDSLVCDARVIKRYSSSPALTIEVRAFISPLS